MAGNWACSRRHTHLFWWLPYVGQDEIGQTIIGRVINVGLWAGSLLLLHRLGRRLLDPLGALVGVVLFAVFSFSIVSADFRIDGWCCRSCCRWPCCC
jgi:hypothetical protein